MQGCFDCAAAGVNGWACTQCTKGALSATDNANCATCYRRASSGNNWGCLECQTAGGSSEGRRAACLACVGNNSDAWACTQCASRYGTPCEAEKCVACLKASGNAWGCYTATYAAQCGGGRRSLGVEAQASTWHVVRRP